MCHFDLIEKEETRVREGVLGMNNEKLFRGGCQVVNIVLVGNATRRRSLRGSVGGGAYDPRGDLPVKVPLFQL